MTNLIFLNKQNISEKITANYTYRKDMEKLLDSLQESGHISGREWGMARERLINAKTLEAVGKLFGVTRERVRQVEAKVKCQLDLILPDITEKNVCPS